MNYDEPDISYDEELAHAGLVRVDDLPDLDHAADHLKGLRDALFKTGNHDDIFFHIEEVLSVFDIELPKDAELRI